MRSKHCVRNHLLLLTTKQQSKQHVTCTWCMLHAARGSGRRSARTATLSGWHTRLAVAASRTATTSPIHQHLHRAECILVRYQPRCEPWNVNGGGGRRRQHANAYAVRGAATARRSGPARHPERDRDGTARGGGSGQSQRSRARVAVASRAKALFSLSQFSKTKNFWRFSVTSNLTAYVWSTKYRWK